MNTVTISESLYEQLVEYFRSRQDADFEGDPGEYVPNEEMRLLSQLDNEFEQYNGTTTTKD